MGETNDELEARYVAIYKELLFELDKLFLLENGSMMDAEMAEKSRLRSMHQLNVSETAALLNMKDTNTSIKSHTDELLVNKLKRDQELRSSIEGHFSLIQEWLYEAKKTQRLREKLVNISSSIPEREEDSMVDLKATQTLEILESIYSVLVVHGGYLDVAFNEEKSIHFQKCLH